MERTTRSLCRYLTSNRSSVHCNQFSLHHLRNYYAEHSFKVDTSLARKASTIETRTISYRLYSSGPLQDNRPFLHRLAKPLWANKNSFVENNCKSSARWITFSSVMMSKRLGPDEVKRRVDDLTDRFGEARELLGDARESLGSTYFSEDMVEAQDAVSTAIATYDKLLADLEEDQRADVVRTIGLRMGELKAQEQAIKDLLD